MSYKSMMTAVASSEEVGIDDGIDNKVIKSGSETNKKKSAVFYGGVEMGGSPCQPVKFCFQNQSRLFSKG
jgi:hypothetical protein